MSIQNTKKLIFCHFSGKYLLKYEKLLPFLYTYDRKNLFRIKYAIYHLKILQPSKERITCKLRYVETVTYNFQTIYVLLFTDWKISGLKAVNLQHLIRLLHQSKKNERVALKEIAVLPQKMSLVSTVVGIQLLNRKAGMKNLKNFLKSTTLMK